MPVKKSAYCLYNNEPGKQKKVPVVSRGYIIMTGLKEI